MNNKILIADRSNHRIQVMNSDLTFSHTFDVKESQPGQFNYPSCIATDSKGMVYITDCGNDQVQKFTLEGVFLSKFRRGGSEEFKHVRGIAIDTTTDTVYISSDHKVSMFTSDGKFLAEFGQVGGGEGEFHTPFGLAFDESTSDLYVCDCDNGRLVVY